ncbi:hypothetical protein CANCADRAFT_71235 [Tortispora caseinolytica NRRL Y-17796]|uniref:Sorbose reductase SOU1 n=1 Tax=Tortispora caseinolytica NRRL Y-17796 TaxID=767744 RepID=A0A1E4TI77_9ASCO|nr:hypothetical protein CANCADRAFT_71235 [Tortispora caseinolytica NRRL Y-17796]
MPRPTATEFTGLGPLPRPAPKLAPNVMDLFSLKGKVASITGSSAGIGWAVAEAYAQAGADVALWYNSRNADEKAKYLTETYGVRSKAYKCNISDAEEIEKTIEQIYADFGALDIQVANAGAAWTSGPMLDVADHKDWHHIVDVDLNGVYYTSKAVGKIFRKQGHGSLIFTASMSGHIVNFPQMQAAYNCAKAAVIHLAKSLAVEWAAFARVNSVSPGYIGTELSNFVDPDIRAKWQSFIPLGREADPRELVGTYLLLASDASTYTTGCDIVVDGGYSCP